MKRGRDEGEMESVEIVNCLMLLSKVGETETNKPSSLERSGRCFRCKTCNKQFPSFQALGGHRASHKKPKLMLSTSHLPMKPKMHPCPICGIEFGIGQALGGHMRKHRTPNTRRSDYLCFDLNLTPSENYLNLNSITPALNCFI